MSIDPKAIEAAKRIISRDPVLLGEAWDNDKVARALLDAEAEIEKHAQMAMHFHRMHGEVLNDWVRDDSGWQKRANKAEAELAAHLVAEHSCCSCTEAGGSCDKDGHDEAARASMEMTDILLKEERTRAELAALRQAVREVESGISLWEQDHALGECDGAAGIPLDILRGKTAPHMGAST